MTRKQSDTFALIVAEHNDAWIEWQEAPDVAERHTYVFKLVALARDGAADLLRDQGDLTDITFHQFRDRLHQLAEAIILDLNEDSSYIDVLTLSWTRTKELLDSYAAHQHS